MQSDRELLELAAKAAGMANDFSFDDDDKFLESANCGFVLSFGRGAWDPLADDGDALRLAAYLKMIIDPYAGVVGVPAGPWIHMIVRTNFCEAIRRAITQTAAEIGKGMK